MCWRNWLATANCECVSTVRSPLLQLTATNKVMYRPWRLAFQDMMIWYGMCLSSVRIGSSTQHGLNGKLQLGDYFDAQARSKIDKFRLDYATKNVAFVLAILSVAGKIYPEFPRLLWVVANMQTVKYLNLVMVGDEENISIERFKWSRACTFSYNRNAIGHAVLYASAIRTQLSVHGTAHPVSAASVRPRWAADCLIRSAVDISHPRQQRIPRTGLFAASGPVRSDIINDIGAGAVGGGGNPSLSPGRATISVPGSVDSASIPLLLGCTICLPMQSQALYRNASSSPLAHCPFSCFDVDKEEANTRDNVVVADGHANVCTSDVMTNNDNDDSANVGDYDDTLSEIPVPSFMAVLSLDLDLAFGVIDSSSTPPSSSIALTFSVHSHRSSLPSPLLLLLLLLGSPSRSSSFHYHNRLFFL